jgi:hypothetical protein
MTPVIDIVRPVVSAAGGAGPTAPEKTSGARRGIDSAGMNYANGSAGSCACGRPAIASCSRCNKAICDIHANTLPETPAGISPDAAGQFGVAVRTPSAPTCEACRAEIGQYALHEAVSAPRMQLPTHWLDRAIALSSDTSRSDLEKLEDADLPSSLTPKGVAEEFLRRVEQPPVERVPISESTVLRKPEYVDGWTVDCRRTEYTALGSGARYRLPCMISVHGELLGPIIDDGKHASATWWIVEESDIELQRLVSAVANILMLSAFVTKQPGLLP